MCEPTSIMMGMGLVMGAVGQHQQGKAANAAAKSNAKMIELQNEDTKTQALAEEDKIRRQGAATKSRQIVQIAANGVEVTTGSAAELIADTAMTTELDAMTLRNNTERAIWRGEYQKESVLAQGANTEDQANMGAVGSLLAGAGKVDSQWTKYKAGQSAFNSKATNANPM